MFDIVEAWLNGDYANNKVLLDTLGADAYGVYESKLGKRDKSDRLRRTEGLNAAFRYLDDNGDLRKVLTDEEKLKQKLKLENLFAKLKLDALRGF